MKNLIIFTIILIIFINLPVQGMNNTIRNENSEISRKDRIAILWTSGDVDVAKKMVFIYTFNAKKQNWFKIVRFIVWGASTKLLSQDKELQEWIHKMKKAGVELFACKWCSDSYGVSGQLTKLGIKVIYYGKKLSEMVKNDWNILTF